MLARSALDPSGLRPPAQFRGVDPSGTELAASDLAEILGVGDGPRVTQAALGDLGFERVRTRAWRSATDELLVVTYEFTRPQGARTFTDLVADAERGGSARALPLPGSRGARAVQFAGSDDPAQVAFLHDGAEAHVVALVGPSAAPGGRLLGELLTAPPSARP